MLYSEEQKEIDMNMKALNHLMVVLGCLLVPVALASCSVIDEDQSDCVQPQAELDYELKLVTNMTTELRTDR